MKNTDHYAFFMIIGIFPIFRILWCLNELSQLNRKTDKNMLHIYDVHFCHYSCTTFNALKILLLLGCIAYIA